MAKKTEKTEAPKPNPADYLITIHGYPVRGVVEWDEAAGTILVNTPDGGQETKSGTVVARLLTDLAAEDAALAEAVAKRQKEQVADLV